MPSFALTVHLFTRSVWKKLTNKKTAIISDGCQLVEKTTFFLQAFLFYTVSLDIHQVSDAEKALPKDTVLLSLSFILLQKNGYFKEK
ncbi:hypothetical protein BSG8_26250 [Bacillus subtilis subsp. natto]|nr:hypothetical protein BSG8_26250 [Bacillus subtilis subsp. natto]